MLVNLSQKKHENCIYSYALLLCDINGTKVGKCISKSCSDYTQQSVKTLNAPRGTTFYEELSSARGKKDKLAAGCPVGSFTIFKDPDRSLEL